MNCHAGAALGVGCDSCANAAMPSCFMLLAIHDDASPSPAFVCDNFDARCQLSLHADGGAAETYPQAIACPSPPPPAQAVSCCLRFTLLCHRYDPSDPTEAKLNESLDWGYRKHRDAVLVRHCNNWGPGAALS